VKRSGTALLLLAMVLALPPEGRAETKAQGLTGNWAGITKVRCGSRLIAQERCNAYQNISFRLIQEGSKISGTYSCAFGTQPCLAMNNSGNITGGSYDGMNLVLNVDMGNGSNCRFAGELGTDKGQGRYRCKGISAAEHGTWRLNRAPQSTIPKEPLIPPAIRP
jgi:hypothetical protein